MTTRGVKLVEKKEFTTAALDPEYEIFIIYVELFRSILLTNADIHSFCKSQRVGLLAKKAFTKVFYEYADFVDKFFPDLASKLLKHPKIKNHVIKLVNSQQVLYEPFYSLESIELKTLKA